MNEGDYMNLSFPTIYERDSFLLLKILDAVPLQILVVNEFGNIIYCNQKVLEDFGAYRYTNDRAASWGVST